MSSAKLFTLAVSDAELHLLHRKLELARFPDELDGAGWDYGVPLADVKRLAEHWKDRFDWRKFEAKLNNLPMFTQDIEVEGFGSLNIHFIHQRSEVPNAIPLLFVHGWPGSFLEVLKLLPLLTASSPDHPSFHVVAPSLPGFAFSEAPRKPGFSGYQYAEVLNKLMLSLGYQEYVYQGGDFGHTLGVYAVNKFGHKHIKAWHSNMPVYRVPTFSSHPLLYLEMLTMPINKYIRDIISAALQIRKTEFGYFTLQATKPQTLAYSHSDSPVGLLAWIYEKLVKASDSYPWTDDEVLEWISVYWFSRAGPAACTRIYYELTHGNTTDMFVGTKWTSVPLGVSYFPREPIRLPEQWAHTIGKVVHQSRHDRGGHFAAFEQPEALVGDLRGMFRRGGPAYGVVPDKDGY
ncbi:epoxide hydrolase [Dichomitus squalens]|uniref:Epoxide hydrolase n=1 Tax=Dichomitus squalens TaxID=114155 RepID=A0A4Q9NDI2_9APHY|nr:epoxide hydrolase [Dichomitus squalens]TBU57388.1 epoxide hydrolase [Dichomitus squalens]